MFGPLQRCPGTRTCEADSEDVGRDGGIRRALPGRQVASTKGGLWTEARWWLAVGFCVTIGLLEGGGAIEMQPGVVQGWQQGIGDDPCSDFRVAANQGFR